MENSTKDKKQIHTFTLFIPAIVIITLFISWKQKINFNIGYIGMLQVNLIGQKYIRKISIYNKNYKKALIPQFAGNDYFG